ncbi:chemotaxis protein CheA [Janthinobacterium fluminis]|uniref:Chemotaxis protein CheA n=1 Tax=Janthinobacterium fluminis TaxID=2987524 RepID=A0ABT5JUP7_9BURK|nr:chemotaxis protein CheA [Janthinobacterium fluminis]MDC8756455.1 chemotaxis protein CheA [Janthinobacterium fluminis]
MTLDDALQTFLAEGGELLEEMEAALLSIDAGGDDGEAVNAIFRAAHTIKGSAGLFGIDHVVAFTHVAESVLDSVRLGRLALDGALVALLLACRDHIGALLAGVQSRGVADDPALSALGAPLVARLQSYLDEQPAAPPAAAPPQPQPPQPEEGADNWHISLRFGAEVLRNGMDPMSFLRYLGTFGRIVTLLTLERELPPLAELDPEVCHLGFEIAFRGAASRAQIDGVFDFVRDDCRIRIVPPRSKIEEYVRLLSEEPERHQMLGEVLLRAGTLTEAELAAVLREQAAAAAPQPIGAMLVEQGIVAPPVVEAALARQNQVREAKTLEGSSIRVDAAKLDHLINLVGELIITTASANLIARRARHPEFQECSSTLSALVEEVRNSALQLRMVKIGATFGRFQRVVHDVARELGKDIGLVISGEDTELDKTVVEKIGDPLTHLVRNAMDHGIEAVDVRLARGKPAQGTIGLHAYHDSGTIVMEVRDDGGGLKRERILAKAIERGLVEAGRSLGDDEIYGLIFEPGFSTAEQVTNLSGRGVGMDVVKRNITALRGSVGVASVEGAGTTVTVRLPLTLAIINGFQVGVGKSVFVVPLDMVEECVEFSAVAGHDYADLRGAILPFIRLRQLFDVGGAASARQSIVVVKYAGQRAGIVVDTLLGESQTVIKPLGKIFQRLDCISGSSILGSGEVALILDVPALIRASHQDGARAGQAGAAAEPAAEADMRYMGGAASDALRGNGALGAH